MALDHLPIAKILFQYAYSDFHFHTSDLKPENIMIKADGHILLTDFDLSKQSPQQCNCTVIKKMFSKDKVLLEPKIVTNSFVGTEEYIAPEVITGYGHTSTVDWWTYGIFLYEILV